MNSDIRIDFLTICREYGIRLAQPGDKHYRSGWLCLPCPFCTGDAGNHLGFNPQANVFTCWRCGRHSKFEVLSALLGMTKGEVYKLCQERFGEGMSISSIVQHKPPTIEPFKLPGKSVPTPAHVEYLESRGLDVDKMRSRYGIRFCGAFDGTYKFRIIIPVKHNGRIVSFTARDITGKNKTRYLSCPKNQERKSIKECLFGDTLVGDNDDVLVVEGPFDAMKMGPGAVAIMGLAFTDEQVRKIARFKRSWLMFDPGEIQARQAEDRMEAMLGTYPGHICSVLNIEGVSHDPGDYTERVVKAVWKYIRRN